MYIVHTGLYTHELIFLMQWMPNGLKKFFPFYTQSHFTFYWPMATLDTLAQNTEIRS